MKAYLVQSLLVVCALLPYTTCLYPDVQAFDIYSGEHLDDTILPSDGSTKSFVHAVLVIYQKECEGLLKEYGIKPDNLPMSKYVMLLRHDYSTSTTHTWYGFSGDDLRGRYNTSACFSAMFIPRGSSSTRPDVMMMWNPDSGVPFKAWVWEQIRVQVRINNHFGAKLSIRTIHSGIASGPRDYPEVMLLPDDATILNLYESTVVHIYIKTKNSNSYTTSDKLIGYWIVNGSLTINVIPSDVEKVFDDVMLGIQEVSRSSDWDVMETAWCTMQRHLLNLKQPLIVPQFTDTGYKKIKVPERWFKILRDFYDAHKTTRRENERWRFGDSFINQNEVQCSMVWLPDEVKEQVADGLKALMEDWCGIELEMTAFYGVREYYGGNVLQNHVDRLDTHVISAIIQIDKDLGGEEDWMLEVIEFGGERNTIALEPGDMLLYESARLIHGRPKMFRGKLYANAFLHYRPLFGWENVYHHDANDFTLHYLDHSTEKLMPLKSDLTQKRGGKGNLIPGSEQRGPHENVHKRDEL